MVWEICLCGSIIVFVGMILGGACLRKKGVLRSRVLSMLNILLLATMVSVLIWVFPFRLTAGGGPLEILFSVFNGTLQVFSLDADYDAIRGIIQCSTPAALAIYRGFGAFLFVLAPLLTVGVVLSFFSDFSTWLRLQRGYHKKLYIFSELNDRSLTLAKSCLEHEKETGGKALILFTDVYREEEETAGELREAAQALGAICLPTDIIHVNVRRHSSESERIFFVIGEDDSENIAQSLALIETYRDCGNTSLYAFTTSQESALLIGSVMDAGMKMTVRRINQVQSLIYNHLYHSNLFQYMIPQEDGEQLLSVAILGMGRYGTELLKALTWCGQIPNCRLELHVFDQDPKAEDKFTSQCPELMRMNDNEIDGEAHYSIRFHHAPGGQGMDVNSSAFDACIAENGPFSMAFVCLGSDVLDVETAIKLRVLFRRYQRETEPVIETVIYQSTKAEIAKSHPLTDYKGNDYRISFIGDLKETCSYEVVFQSELERKARERHLAWADKSNQEVLRRETTNFYKYEYFFRSSIASVIRRKLREDAGVPGIDKPAKERTREERIAIQRMEHAGWNAYMRSEGFCYGPVRDDLAKIHHLLIPFDQLPLSEQIKDDD